MLPADCRVLFNGDCTFLFRNTYNEPDKPMGVDALHRFVDRLHASGINALLMNGNAQVPWYPSKRTRHILTGYKRNDVSFIEAQYPPLNEHFTAEQRDHRYQELFTNLNRYLDFLEAGVDWYATIFDRCREHGMRPMAAIRMNDMHGSTNWSESFMNCDLQKDPAYRLSGRGVDPSQPIVPSRQSLNYAHAEVRQYMLDMVREAVEDYQVEGVELDWLRCPFCCDAPASQQNIDDIIAFHAQAKAICDEGAKRLGKPVPLGIRVPVRLGMCKAIGLDVPAMTRQGILDFVGFSNYFQSTWDVPYDELRQALGPNVSITGILEAVPNWLHYMMSDGLREGYRTLPSGPPIIRGNAAGKLAMGVDAIESFNFFCPDEHSHQGFRDGKMAWDTEGFVPKLTASYETHAELKSLDQLRGTEKQYTLASQQGYYMFEEFEYAEQLPCVVEPGTKHPFRISMCAEPADADLELWAQVVIEKPEGAPRIGVSFNGAWPTFDGSLTDQGLLPCGEYVAHVEKHAAYDFRLPVEAIRDGWNELLVIYEANETNKQPIRVVSIEIAVKFC